MEQRHWFNGLQALRAILFIIILLAHSLAFFPVEILGGGAPAVSCFFVMSGFLSGYFFKQKHRGDIGLLKECVSSVFKKVAKFYPLYFVMLVVSIFAVGGTPGNFVKCLFLLQSYFGDAATALSFNWVSWFLSSMLLCYLLSPVLNRACVKVEHRLVFVVVLMICLMGVAAVWGYSWRTYRQNSDLGYYFTYIFPPLRVLEYLEGILLALLFRAREQRACPKYYVLFEGCVLLLFIAMLVYGGQFPTSFRAVKYIPISLFLVWIFAREGAGLVRIIACKPLVSMGAYAFELYIVHRMVLVIFAGIGTTFLHWVLAVMTTFIVSYVAKELTSEVRKSLSARKANAA